MPTPWRIIGYSRCKRVMIVNENMTVTWNLQRERGVRIKNPLYVCVCVFEGGGGGGQGEFFCNSTINFWPPNVFLFNRVIRLCLSIWNRSPEAYKELRASGMLTLPSGRLLQMYKNSCAQNPGLNESVGQWMAQEATKRKLGPEGREGGIILDEMAIQVSFPGNKLTSHLKVGWEGIAI